MQKASQANSKPHNNTNINHNGSLGQPAPIHVLSQKAMGTQRDAVRHLPLWRKRSRAISRQGGGRGGRRVRGGGDRRANQSTFPSCHYSCAAGATAAIAGFPIDMYTVQHTLINMNTANRGFTMLTGGDGRKRKWPLKNKSHDRRRKMAIKKRSHDSKKTEALKDNKCDEEFQSENRCYLFGCREKFRDCMHGILHMEQNFKGEYSSLLFLCVPLLIQGSVCLFFSLLFFLFFLCRENTSASKQSKELHKCFSTVQNHSSCSLTSRDLLQPSVAAAG